MRRHFLEAADRARAHHGRRNAPAQRRLLEFAAPPDCSGAGTNLQNERRPCRGPGFPRAQRSVLPQRRHGDGKGADGPGRNIEACSVVTAMSRNGTDFGIRVSGTGDRWFTASVEMPVGLYFPGFSARDANPDIGDSAIVETIGLGAFAMAAAPAVVGYLGAGRASEAATFTRSMAEIVAGHNPAWTIPGLDFAGVPTGIDIRLVVETQLAPTINTGIAHREPGVGQVGAGVVKAPLKCFEDALVAFAETMDLG